MRAVIQRVTQARVEVSGSVAGEIGHGLLILLGIAREDTLKDVQYLVHKITGLRIFQDQDGKMNRSVRDIDGSLLVVSQFTLYGDSRRGMRPSFDAAASPDQARQLYESFLSEARATGIHIETGVFKASMQVTLTNDGPVTLICESVNLTSME